MSPSNAQQSKLCGDGLETGFLMAPSAVFSCQNSIEIKSYLAMYHSITASYQQNISLSLGTTRYGLISEADSSNVIAVKIGIPPLSNEGIAVALGGLLLRNPEASSLYSYQVGPLITWRHSDRFAVHGALYYGNTDDKPAFLINSGVRYSPHWFLDVLFEMHYLTAVQGYREHSGALLIMSGIRMKPGRFHIDFGVMAVPTNEVDMIIPQLSVGYTFKYGSVSQSAVLILEREEDVPEEDTQFHYGMIATLEMVSHTYRNETFDQSYEFEPGFAFGAQGYYSIETFFGRASTALNRRYITGNVGDFVSYETVIDYVDCSVDGGGYLFDSYGLYGGIYASFPIHHENLAIIHSDGYRESVAIKPFIQYGLKGGVSWLITDKLFLDFVYRYTIMDTYTTTGHLFIPAGYTKSMGVTAGYYFR